MDNFRTRRERRNAERRAKLVSELMGRTNVPEDVAEKAVKSLETERPILAWLAKVDWAALIELALKLLPLFLEPAPTAAAPVDSEGT